MNNGILQSINEHKFKVTFERYAKLTSMVQCVRMESSFGPKATRIFITFNDDITHIVFDALNDAEKEKITISVELFDDDTSNTIRTYSFPDCTLQSITDDYNYGAPLSNHTIDAVWISRTNRIQ